MARDPNMREHLKSLGLDEMSLPHNQTDMSITNKSVMMNQSRQDANNDSAELQMFVPRNLEETLNNMEDSFWYILNNPQCYKIKNNSNYSSSGREKEREGLASKEKSDSRIPM